mgnify:CR=1 FL=1
MICAYEECSNKFEPKTHNQKYFSEECCKIATNLKVKEKYFYKKARIADRKSTRLNSSHSQQSRMPSSA